jgi:hypothetical protein
MRARRHCCTAVSRDVAPPSPASRPKQLPGTERERHRTDYHHGCHRWPRSGTLGDPSEPVLTNQADEIALHRAERGGVLAVSLTTRKASDCARCAACAGIGVRRHRAIAPSAGMGW